ncbi:FliM/FliN family flagellar motor C-terminal domain-containing protein [Planctomycetota bacterium]
MTKEKVQQLLSAVGIAPKEEDLSNQVKEHNWKQPHFFSIAQLEKIGNFLQTTASLMAEKFSELCNNRFDVSIVSGTQHFTEEFSLVSSDDKQKDYYLPFGNNEEYFGFIGIPEQTAIIWAKQLLGDNDAEDNPERKLSGLEESLLMDLSSALIEVLSVSFAGDPFSVSKSLIFGRWPLKIQDTNELFKVSLNVKKADTDSGSDAYFLILCSKLESVAGIDKKKSVEYSQDEISQMILNHLGHTPVSVKVNLSCAEVSFEEMMNLQPDDVILLEGRIDEPVELIVNERIACYGWPVKSDGEYAVKISDANF